MWGVHKVSDLNKDKISKYQKLFCSLCFFAYLFVLCLYLRQIFKLWILNTGKFSLATFSSLMLQLKS